MRVGGAGCNPRGATARRQSRGRMRDAGDLGHGVCQRRARKRDGDSGEALFGLEAKVGCRCAMRCALLR